MIQVSYVLAFTVVEQKTFVLSSFVISGPRPSFVQFGEGKCTLVCGSFFCKLRSVLVWRCALIESVLFLCMTNCKRLFAKIKLLMWTGYNVLQCSRVSSHGWFVCGQLLHYFAIKPPNPSARHAVVSSLVFTTVVSLAVMFQKPGECVIGI